MRSVWPIAAAVVLALIGPSAYAQNEVKAEEKAFKSIDGVKLQGLFYKTLNPKGKDAPTVLVLHGYGQKTDDAAWDDTAKTLAANYNVFRFDFRGHGKSTDIDPTEFWLDKYPNKKYVRIKPPLSTVTKNTIKWDDFQLGYYPALVQDLAAARHELDRMNDANLINSSMIYILASGDMTHLTLFFIASEWQREKKKPGDILLHPRFHFVSPNRPLTEGFDPAGQDYAGCAFLGPNRHQFMGNVMTNLDMKTIIYNPRTQAVKLRTETPMVFLSGAKNTKDTSTATSLLNEVLMVNARVAPNGVEIAKPDLIFNVKIDNTALSGVKLLGNNLGTETQLEKFIKDISEKERKAKTWTAREWDKPLLIDVMAYGALR